MRLWEAALLTACNEAGDDFRELRVPDGAFTANGWPSVAWTKTKAYVCFPIPRAHADMDEICHEYVPVLDDVGGHACTCVVYD